MESLISPCWKRLEDCHMLLHQAEENYFEPEKFRLFLQQYITTLRTVTFILQKQKNNFPDFDNWYQPHQSNLSTDSIMSWLVNTRNIIEKEGDLEANSILRVELIANHLEKNYLVLDNNNECLFSSFSTLLEMAQNKMESTNIANEGMFRISRRWVANSYSSEELLKLCIYGYKKLQKILEDAENHLCLSTASIKCEKNNIDIPHCIEFTSEIRSKYIRIDTLEPIILTKQAVHISKKDSKKIQKRYDKLLKITRNTSQVEFIKELYEKCSKAMFTLDGGHITLLLFLKDSEIVRLCQLHFDDKVSKYKMMNDLAYESLKLECNGIALIGEGWGTEILHPNQDISKIEMLSMMFLNKEGTSFSLDSTIRRNASETRLEETFLTEDSSLNILAPFYKVWGLPFDTQSK